MSLLERVFQPITKPVIVDGADLRRYIAIVTCLAVCTALLFDIANQMLFFESWTVTLRSWTLTILVASGTAVPISLMIGRSQRELYRAKQKFEMLSRTDWLTGLPNRRALMEAAEEAESLIVVLVIVDIDRFKSLNDTHGHRAGDAVIREVGIRLAACLSATMVGRLGGEEFAMLASAEALDPIVSHLMQFRTDMVARPIMVDGTALSVTISAGVAARAPKGSFDRLYSDADEALYRAKRSGRNRIELSPSLGQLQNLSQLRHQVAA